ncbi:MAG: serine/threonine protein kinase [Deltaproteobacteria bacterium]|nr:serine/threonine protein kinase [Deltaproteobacteria bacterium]
MVELAKPDARDPYVGRVIAGRYQIERKLNQGGMGAVYLAIQRPLDRPVALKVLLRRHDDDKTAALRFEKEARAVSRLAHPHVVTLHDFGNTEAGELYIAMEYLEGQSLRELLDSAGAMAWDRSLHVMRGVAAALTAAHGAGIVHRDLKPENVMLVERSGDVDFPKVLDFGLARSIEPDNKTPITQRDVIPGTPAYMSPERASGVSDDPRSDLYSLGAMWFELLTGRPPFEGESSIKVILRHIHETPLAPSQRVPAAHIPQSIDLLVLSLLEKHPERRPGSAADLLEQIDTLARPQGWHVSSTERLGRRSGSDVDLSGFADAVGEIDELSFSLADALADEPSDEPVPLVALKRPLGPTHTEMVAGPMPAPTPLPFFPSATPPRVGAAPMLSPPAGALPRTPSGERLMPLGVEPAVADQPVLLVTRKAPTAPPSSTPPVAAAAAPPRATPLTEPPRTERRATTQTQTPAPATLRIASLPDVAAHLASAKTAREVAELAVAFLATRFDRCFVADLRGGVQVLAAHGIPDVSAIPGAIARCAGMRELLGRKDAFYGASVTSTDWLHFFRAFGGHMPGALFVGTLKREAQPAFLFYGDHRDLHLRPDVRDTVGLLREAAAAFSVTSL